MRSGEVHRVTVGVEPSGRYGLPGSREGARAMLGWASTTPRPPRRWCRAVPTGRVVELAGHLCGVCVDDPRRPARLDLVGTARLALGRRPGRAARAAWPSPACSARWNELGPQVEAIGSALPCRRPATQTGVRRDDPRTRRPAERGPVPAGASLAALAPITPRLPGAACSDGYARASGGLPTLEVRQIARRLG